MNKAELIIELGNIKSEIMNANLTALPARTAFMESMEEKLDKAVLGLINEEDKYNTCDCQDCPAMNKVDDLIEATKLREWLAETASKTALEVEKMARGGTD